MTVQAAVMTRRSVLSGLGPVVATVLAACQPGQRPGGPPAPAAPKVSGTVIFRDWRAPTGAPQLERWYQFVQDEFTQRYPGTRVEFEFVPWGESTWTSSPCQWPAARLRTR